MIIADAWLLNALKNSDCECSDEIAACIVAGEISYAPEFSEPCSVEQIRSINEFRMRDKRKYESFAHGRRLKREVFEFIQKAEAHKSDNLVKIDLWKDPNEIYGLCILENTSEILGAIHFYDKTRTSEAEWELIWGKAP